jgi:hypothetical protein
MNIPWIFLFIRQKITGLSSIDEISYSIPQIDIEMRKKFKVLFIDDKELSIIDTLKNDSGYDVKYKKDGLDNIYDANIYDIILCDLQGVNAKSPYEGASLIKDLRMMYPNKQLILYTAGNLSNDQLELIQEYSDKRVQKGQSKETWEMILDESIREIIDPCKSWGKTKKYLEKIGVKTKDIAIFEDIFVRSYQNGKIPDRKQMIAIFGKYKKFEEYEKILLPIIKSVIGAKGK